MKILILKSVTNLIVLIKSIEARIPKFVDNSQDPLLEHLLKLSPHENTIILETSDVNIVQYSHYINELITILSDQTLIEETRISVESQLLAFVSHIPKINVKDTNPYPHFYLSRVLMDNFDIIYNFISVYYNLNLTSTLTKFLVKLVYSLQFWEIFHLIDSVKNLKEFLNLLDFEITDTSLGYLVKPPKNYLEENLYQGFQYPFPYPFYNYSYHKLGDNIPEKYSKITIKPYIDISLKNVEAPRKRRKPKRERRSRYLEDYAEIEDEDLEIERPRKLPSRTPERESVKVETQQIESPQEVQNVTEEPLQPQPLPDRLTTRLYSDSYVNNTPTPIYPYATYHLPYIDPLLKNQSNNKMGIQNPNLQIHQYQVIQQQLQFIQRHQQQQLQQQLQLLQQQQNQPQQSQQQPLQQQQQQLQQQLQQPLQHQLQAPNPNDNNNQVSFPPISNPYGYPMQYPYPMYQQPYQVDARGQILVNTLNPIFYNPNPQYQSQFQQVAPVTNQNANVENEKTEEPKEALQEPKDTTIQEEKPQENNENAESEVEESGRNSVNNDDSDYEDNERNIENIKRRAKSTRIRKPRGKVDKSEDSEKSEKEDTENLIVLKEQVTDDEELSGDDEKSKSRKTREIHQCDGFDANTNAPCRKIFYGRNELLRHKEYVHATRKRIYKCIYCARYNSKVQSYPRPDSLARHLRRNHQINGKENKLAVGYAKQHLVIIEDPSKLTHTQLLEIATSPLPHPPFLEPDFSLKANRTGFLLFNTKGRDERKDFRIEDKEKPTEGETTQNRSSSASQTPSQSSSQHQSPHNQTTSIQPPQLPKVNQMSPSSYYDPTQQSPPSVLPYQPYNNTYQNNMYQAPLNSFVNSYSNQNSSNPGSSTQNQVQKPNEEK